MASLVQDRLLPRHLDSQLLHAIHEGRPVQAETHRSAVGSSDFAPCRLERLQNVRLSTSLSFMSSLPVDGMTLLASNSGSGWFSSQNDARSIMLDSSRILPGRNRTAVSSFPIPVARYCLFDWSSTD